MYTTTMKILNVWNHYSAVFNVVVLSSASALLLFLARSLVTGNARFSFMAWNLVLSLLALAASVGFIYAFYIKIKWLTIFLFIVWLFLLPNTFYMLTDFVHVKDTGDINMLFDIVLIGLFAMNGYLHGMISLVLVHRTLLKMFSKNVSATLIAAIILASSFAVDMGRFLRWNSWDILVNPRALIFDITNTLLNPSNYHRSFLITGVFFITSGSIYLVFWELSRLQWSKS